MGEARRHHWPTPLILLIGLAIATGVWLLAVLWLGAPAWLLPFIPPLTILGEWFKLPLIDDNAVMLLLPLAFIEILHMVNILH
jgi:hypothetical protein